MLCPVHVAMQHRDFLKGFYGVPDLDQAVDLPLFPSEQASTVEKASVVATIE